MHELPRLSSLSWLRSTVLRQGVMADCSEVSNEHLGSVKCGEFY
jgi:hypothetical protein